MFGLSTNVFISIPTRQILKPQEKKKNIWPAGKLLRKLNVEESVTCENVDRNI